VTTTERPALFLDRDGVVNEDRGYCHRIDQFHWIPGVFDTVRTAHSLGLAVIIVTNQAGIGRGLYSEDQFHRLTEWMIAEFQAAAAPLSAVYHCPFHPDALPPYNIQSPLRKPQPGMLLQAAADHCLDLSRSVLIGDTESDIGAGRAAGLKHTALFTLDPMPETEADIVLREHAGACAWLLDMFGHPRRD
jgi:D-glycero-D-manno-heptose 1,7-bisphosphate phosphatase